MKTKLLAASLVALSLTANAQWATEQNTSFGTASRGISDVTVVNKNIVWAVGYDGTGAVDQIAEFTTTKDGGTTWTPGSIAVPAGQGYDIANISAVNGDTAWASVFPGATNIAEQGIYRTYDAGLNWTKVTNTEFTNGSSFVNVVHFFNDSVGFAMGDPIGGYYEVYTTSNAGTSWTRVPNTGNQLSASNSSEYGIVGLFSTYGDSTIWFGTNFGRLFKSTDRGNTWTVAATGYTGNATTQAFSKIVFRDAMNGLIAKSNSRLDYDLRVTTDGGLTFSAVTVSGTCYAGDMCAVPGSNLFVSTGVASAHHGSSLSRDNGATWELMEDTVLFPSNQRPQRYGVGFADTLTGWAGHFTDQNPAIGGIWKWGGNLFTVGTKKAIASTNSIGIYPNPAKNIVNVTTKTTGALVSVANMLGQKVMETLATATTTTLEINSLPAGVYFVNVYENNKVSTQKLIKE